MSRPTERRTFVHRITPVWGDLDSARIVYTGRFTDYTMRAIDAWFAAQAVHLTPLRILSTAKAETGHVERAHGAIERAGLSGNETSIAGMLSHGAQRQLEITMTLAIAPKALLLDEPLAGMGQGRANAWPSCCAPLPAIMHCC